MGASAAEPLIVTIKNSSDKDFKGSVRVVLDSGLKAEPSQAPITVKKGETASASLSLMKDQSLNQGKLRQLSVETSVCDEGGRAIDWSRRWLKVGCPVELAMATPREFNPANQPVPVRIKNLANKPVSGTIRVEMVGPTKMPAIEQPFGPVAAGEVATIQINVPSLDVRGYNWIASFTAKASGLETSLAYPMVVERRWLLLGPFPNFTTNAQGDGIFSSYDVDYGVEKQLAGGIDIKQTWPVPRMAAPTWGGWDGLRKQWADYINSSPVVKWTASPPVRAVPGGPHAESIGYLNLYDYYQDIAKLPNQIATTYCLQYVKSPDDRKVVMYTGQAGWMRVWVNGKEVLSDKTPRSANPNSSKTNVELKAGWNEVVLKQGTAFYGYGFYFDLRGADGNPLSDVLYSIEKKD